MEDSKHIIGRHRYAGRASRLGVEARASRLARRRGVEDPGVEASRILYVRGGCGQGEKRRGCVEASRLHRGHASSHASSRLARVDSERRVDARFKIAMSRVSSRHRVPSQSSARYRKIAKERKIA